VRQLRYEQGWSQEVLAERAEMDRSYIAGIEVGARNPTLKALQRLARAFGLSVRDLFP
jgi:transcriptional regulator with XRE-family HTH domain